MNQHAIVSITDSDGDITYVNDHFCQISGYTRDELLGQNHRIIKSSIHKPEFYEDIWQTITSGNVWQGEICNLGKNGKYYWVESTITPFLDRNGIPYQYVSIRTDITKIKEKELTLNAIFEGTAQTTGTLFFERAVEGLAKALHVRIGFIAQRNSQEKHLLDTLAFWDSDHIAENFSYPVANTPCEKVLRNETAIYTDNITTLFAKDLWLKENNIKSYIGIPLLDSEGKLLGHMGIMDSRAIEDANEKLDLLNIFTARVASEIERSKSYERLQLNESKYRTLSTNIPGMVYRGHKDWSVEFISNNEKLCGYSSEELQTSETNWLTLIHPDDRPRVTEESITITQKPATLVQQYRIVHKNGEIRWVSDHKQSLFIDGHFSGVDGVVFDITDRIVVEQALELHKERLRRGQVFANIGTWDWNIETGDLFWSERIAPLFGYPTGELETSYDNFLEAVHPDDRQAVIDAVTDCIEKDIPYDIEHRVVWPDGTVRWLHERGAVTRDKNNIPVQMIGVVRDIDERKKAEAALAESEEKLRRFYEHSPVGIALNKMDGSFIESNQSFLDIIGYTEEECRNLTYWQLTPEEYAPQEEQQLISLKKTGRYGPYEKEYFHKDGHRVPVLLNGSIMHDKHGEPLIWSIVQDISARKQVEISFKESQERFAFAVEGVGDGIWDWNMITNEMKFSRLYMDMLGYTEFELPHHANTWIESVHPDDLERIQQNLQDYLSNKTHNYHVELRLRCKDQSYKWILCRGEVVKRDNDGNPVRMIGIHSDITEQKLARIDLDRLKTTLDMTKDCVFMFEPENLRFFYANQGAVNQFGYSETELLSMTPIDIKPDFDEKSFREMISPLIKGELDSLTFDTIHRHKNGSEIPVEIAVQYIAPKGEMARFVAIVRNITERKLMQEKMQQQKKMLDMLHKSTTDFVSKGDFRETMDAMLDTLLEITGSEYGFTGEVLIDDKGCPYMKTHAITNIAWNTETRNLYDNAKAKGFEFHNLDTLFGHVMTTRAHVISNNPSSDPRSGGLPKGHPVMHSFYGAPIFYGNEMVGMYGIANRKQGYDESLQLFLRPFDATYGVMINSKRMTEMEHQNRIELISAKEEAERANRAKSEFLSSMSHELRTPMNAILGFGQLMNFDENLDSEHKDSVNEILTAGHHLLELINEVLDLAKVESGQIELSMEPVAICHVIEECMSLIAPLAIKHGIAVHESCLQGIAVRADHTRLKQAVINLLSNAIKYNHDGGKVTIDAMQMGNRVRILVKDTGLGIDPERLDELFQPFNRLDAEGSNIEGTGIGLSITQRIVEMMGGEIGVQTELGVGSTFWIELPSEEHIIDAHIESDTAINVQHHVHHTRTHTILYIEDNPANLKLVSHILGHRQNIKLLTAHTPTIGIELALTRQPELILLDINMPEMNGYQVLKILKSNSVLSNVPVVAVTANAMEKDIRRGKQAGFHDYITKPIDITNFLSIIDGCLQNNDKE
ncbi:MAG: PAS domain S-box protein [Gammaproteobacteria bacterium]|nr:PAS domain S-box protein [Gammaproteobacteria bacterium]